MAEGNPLRSEYNPQLITSSNVDGKVRIIDPNPYGEGVPHEDLYVYVNLTADQRSRSVLTETGGKVTIENDTKNTVNLVVPQQVTGEDLFGPVTNLTTDWTEIGGPGTKQLGKDFEGFGITNVDIEIKSQTTPKVVIDFVDVRGATLMEQGSCSPYGLFFNLPYPVFYLTIKGYYGKPVKYYLNLTKFNCKFNSDTGNMECRGEFIGWSFAFLSDIIVSYVQASQYLDNGKYNQATYLKEAYEKTWEFYKDNKIVPEDSTNIFCNNPAFNTPCCTIKDLLFALDKLNKNDLPEVKGSPEFVKVQNLITLKNAYDSYSANVRKLFTDLEKMAVTITPSNAYGDDKSRYERIDINALNDDIRGVLKSYFDKKSGTLSTLIGIIKSTPVEDSLYGGDIVKVLTSLNRVDFENTNGDRSLLYDQLNDEPWQWNILDTWLNLGYTQKEGSPIGLANGSYGYIDLGYILKNIDAEVEVLNNKIDEIKKVVVDDLNAIITNRIGFNPTIRNIFTVLTCNVDAFMRLLLDISQKAEQYHDANTKNIGEAKDGAQNLIQSGVNKIFSWPTYFEGKYTPVGGNGQQQGTKEAYPGKNTSFRQWVEVKFVEDFITAFLNFVKDLDVLNDNKENKPGFDNYVPISPLESPLFNPDARIKYYDIEPLDVNTVIGERLFVSLDHTLFQPIRLTNESIYIPPIGRKDFNWNPFQDSKTELAKDIAVIDAWNFINTQENEKIISTACQGDAQTFITNVINSLEQKGSLQKDVKGSDLKKIPNTVAVSSSFGFKDDELFYVYKPTDGEIKLNGTSGNNVSIKPNPYDMLTSNPDSIFKIIDEAEGNDARQLNITSDEFLQAINSYQKSIIESTPSGDRGDFGENTTDNPKNEPIVDEKQRTISFNKSNLFTTLAIKNRKGDINEWWTNSDLRSLKPSNMGQLTYWDYLVDDETYGIGFRSNPYPSDAYVWNKDNGAPGGINVTEQVDTTSSGVNDPFITSPLWVDNVNKFREAAGGSGSKLNTFGLYSETEKVERRNLAYLFLHTLKPTPLVIRHIDDDGGFKSARSSDVYSIKAFNTAGGIVKVPKAWLLALGAQLWRWKNFVGLKGDGSWVKPLKGEIPTGFDLLSQPGFNGTSGVNPDIGSTRNNFINYLNRIYGSKTWATSTQTSSFSNNYMSVGPHGSPLSEGSYAAFDYYAIYQLPNGLGTGSLGQKIEAESDKTEKFGPTWYLGPRTAANAAANYNWPQLWIAPHHIPYVHPPVFDDTSEWEGSLYVQLFRTSIGYVDYQSFMPVTIPTADFYYEDNSSTPNKTFRSRGNDGNLGAIIQFLPDKVKDIIVAKFEEFCDNEWVDLLQIVDPANFGKSPQSKLTDSYELYTSENNKDLFPAGDAGNGAFLFRNGDVTNSNNNTGGSGGPQKVRDSLMAQQYWLINSTPKIWYGIDYEDKNNFVDSFIVSKNVFEEYLKTFHAQYQTLKPKRIQELNKTKTEEEQDLGGVSLEDTDIKLSLYRTFKSLTDKWISIDSSGKQFFNVTQDGSSGKCKGENGSKPTLASHFQYVNRAMGDIGNEAVIDITKLNELKTNLKISLYQYISDILTDNEYMFFPLPAYINFTADGVNDNDLKDMFRPIMSLDNVSCGPLFLSMYVGGNSRQLDLQLTANCPKDIKAIREQNLRNDSFNFSTLSTNFPTELTANNNQTQDKGYTVFKVVYGLENQNHFKNIQLDQSEFSETSESLLAIDKLAQQGGTDQTTKGQNLNSVYLTRSYTCQVESLGNMMIQPMTYFDLFGVPMFNGAYLITEVKHNIKPNHATTSFKGVRQPKATIPVVTSAAAAMNMTLKGIEARKGARSLNQIRSNITLSPTRCGYSSCVITRNGLMCALNKQTEKYPYKDLNSWLGWATSKGYTSDADSDKVLTRAKKLIDDFDMTEQVFIKFLSIESGGGNPKADNDQGCYGIIQFCTRTGAAELLKTFSVNGKDGETGIALNVASDIKNQPLWRQLDYTYNYFKSNSFLLKNAERGSDGKILLSDFYLIILNPKSILTKGLDTDLQIPDRQARLFYECSTSTDFFPIIESDINPICKKPYQKMTFSQKSKSVILGSSSVGTLKATQGTIIGAPNNGVDISYNCEGTTVKGIIDMLKQDGNTYKNVKVVYLAGIGTNDGYKDLGIKELNDLVVQKFPNAKKVILPGTYGWENVKDKTKTDQDNYYSIFVNYGWIYDYPVGVTAEAKTVAQAHNEKSDWFIALTNLMKKYNVS